MGSPYASDHSPSRRSASRYPSLSPSLPLTLPVATPYAIVYGSGYVGMPRMGWVGFWIYLIDILVVSGLVALWLPRSGVFTRVEPTLSHLLHDGDMGTVEVSRACRLAIVFPGGRSAPGRQSTTMPPVGTLPRQ